MASFFVFFNKRFTKLIDRVFLARELTDLHQPVKVMNVYVDEHPVEPCENLFVDRSECFGKGNIILHRKNGLIIDLTLYPIHQMGYVLKDKF